MIRGRHGEGTPAFALIADADDEARAELAQLLVRLRYEVVEAGDGHEAREVLRRRTPAMVVLDVGLAGGAAYEFCRELRDVYGYRLPIVFVSRDRTEPADEVAGLLLGADEYFAKPILADLFLARTRRLIDRSAARGRTNSTLTPREREVLALLAQGLARTQIAGRLHISDKTVATHIEHILAKLGAHSQAQAVAFALRDRLVDVAA